jgi:hypothetical protein
MISEMAKKVARKRQEAENPGPLHEMVMMEKDITGEEIEALTSGGMILVRGFGGRRQPGDDAYPRRKGAAGPGGR